MIYVFLLEPQPKIMADFEAEIERIRRIDFNSEYTKTKAYWRKYVKSHDKLNMKEPKNSYEEKISRYIL